MALVDLLKPIPVDKKGLVGYVEKHYEPVRKAIEENPKNKAYLEDIVQESIDKYAGHLKKGRWAKRLADIGSGIQHAGDGFILSTGGAGIIPGLGIKYLGSLAKIPEKLYSVYYGVRTGDYMGAATDVLKGALSYLPFATFADTGLNRTIKRRIVKASVNKFMKKAGIYEPWHKRLHGQLKDKYSSVKDRWKSGHIRSPNYEPSPA